jgi:hypothetical protein
MDLRYRIGLLLTTYGAILAVRGLSVPELILGLNVNLYGGRSWSHAVSAPWPWRSAKRERRSPFFSPI